MTTLSADAARPCVTLVGAGPGDPELLTLKAVKALGRATLALVDDLVDARVLGHLPPGARVVRVGKRGGCRSTPQAFIHRLMIGAARRGERVVRVKGGDPFVFGRGGEECDALRAAGIDVEVVGGLTAGLAAPQSAGVAVTDRRHTRGVALVTGHAEEGGPAPDWAALARCGLTIVVYMGVARVESIAAALLEAGMAPATPAAVVSGGHTAHQREAACTLATLAATVREQALPSPAILVIGSVVQASALWATTAAEAPATVSGRRASAAAAARC